MALYVDADYTVDDADYFTDNPTGTYVFCDYWTTHPDYYAEGDETCPITETTTQNGGWLSEEQLRSHDEHRRKRKKRERELEETIELAYKRLTGKLSAKAVLEPAKDDPEKLAKLGEQLAAQLVTKSNDSARLRTRNAQIIADLKRQALEVIELNQMLMMEEEAIVLLLLN